MAVSEQQSFDLHEETERDLRSTRFGRWSAGAVAVMLLVGGGILFLVVATGRSAVPPVAPLSISVMLLGLGLFWIVVISYRAVNPGYSWVMVSSRELRLVPYREKAPRVLRWESNRFFLRLVKDEWQGSVSQTLDYTDRWAPKVISYEAFDAIMDFAKSARMSLRERRTWGGIRTYVEVRPPDSGDQKLPAGSTSSNGARTATRN